MVQGTDESLCAKGLDKIEHNELNIVFNKNGHKLKGPSVAVPSLGLKVAAAFLLLHSITCDGVGFATGRNN